MLETDLKERMDSRNKAIFKVMKNEKWFTLKEINELTGYPSATASAGIRDFRKSQFGSNIVEKNYLGKGIYQYKLIIKSPLISQKLG